MTSIIKFTALSGSKDESPPCYLLEIDDFCILLDCGLNSFLDSSLLDPLKQYADKIDAVLLSYPDLTHMGGLPYAVGKLGLKGTIYATTPTFKMGQMFLYDLYQNKMEQQEFELFDLDDVDACFEKKRFQELSFSQHYTFEGGKGNGISITPYLAGHMIGGAIWKITKETDTIIYAVDYNHRKEGHLDGLQLTSDLLKPSLLITDSRNALKSTSFKKTDRDKMLLDTMRQTLRSNGNVLLPVDTAGRVLELLLCIESYWSQNRLGLYDVVFLNHETSNICEFAKSQLEFMSAAASIKFEQRNENVFSFRNIKLCNSIHELDSLSNPKVVLASSQDMETGFSRDLFIQWAQDPRNLIMMTDVIHENTLSSQLFNIFKQKSKGESIQLNQGRRVDLEGEELREYELKVQKEKDEIKLAEKKRKEEELELQRLSNPDQDQDQDIIKIENINPFKNRFDLSMDIIIKEGVLPMFPYFEKHIKWGEYGEEDDTMVKENFEDTMDEEMVAVDTVDVEYEDKPKKIVNQQFNIQVNCKLQNIDYEGCSDGRSIKTIIQQISPTNLVLIRGNDQCSSNIKNYVVDNLRVKNVYIPDINQQLDLTSDTNVYKVILKDSLVNTLKPSKLSGYEISYIEAKVEVDKESNNGTPTLEALQLNESIGHQQSFIGDMKLSDLKQILLNHGLQVQFDQGILNCNDLVYIWREEDIGGNSLINVDGILSDEYYLVRELLYKQYQIL
ncbi:hypothetical protein CYY_009063 [Polysphondylium violaceum]|uniref:Cleavage and polyadenylation specificity factor subunit 2 n=1 Tax=Polysphondylium violaceum TaxID=133409 RepID=A0A8J4UWF0_9MYCE|nr:hypothetical protein CYY_009063 [Polysphondylium violaceum]